MRNTYIILLFALLLSCRESEKEKIMRIVSEWQDKKVIFPTNILFTRFGTDTLDYSIPQTKNKILVYVDSIGCTSCKLQLPRWKNFIQLLDSTCNDSVPVLIFLNTKSIKDIQHVLKRDKYDLPICIDIKDSLNVLNNFPQVTSLQTFLLDKDNKVVAIGNPIHNSKIKDLYLNILTGKASPESSLPKTTAEAEHIQTDFGTFSSKETKEALFKIKNTGTSPLVIADVSTSCGCTAAQYDKHPAPPGETLNIKVTITPKDKGFFEETITVKCNTPSSPIKLSIKGHAQ